MQNKPMGPGDHMTPQNSTNLMYILANCHATCVSVFLRSNFGEEAFGGFTGAGAFIMVLLAAGADHTGVMTWYFWAWLFALAFQRMVTTGNKRAGRLGHSRYNGWPKVAMAITRAKTETKARNAEPALCIIAGLALYQFSEVAGLFVMAGAFSMMMVEGMHRWIDHRKVQRMRDAQVEAGRMGKMYRGEEF